MRTTTQWALPTGLAAAIAAGAVLVPSLASADPDLPPTTAAELLVDLADAQAQPFSGTVVQTTDLGLPELPTGPETSELTSLIAGSTTVRLWYGGPEQVRIAVLGTLAETDVVRNGNDLYLWRSDSNTAQHLTLPDRDDGADDATGREADPPVPGGASPADAAEAALAAIDPSTAVTLDGTASVAGRDAYELVIEPRDTESLIGEVRLAVDAATSMPLRVQVTARGASEPAYENGFESVSFEAPSPEVFEFAPPPGAEVTELAPGEAPPAAEGLPDEAKPHEPGDQQPTVVGEGWTSVLVLRGVDPASLADDVAGGDGGGVAATLLQAFRPVSGEYGTGRVFGASLLSVLMLDDGRTLVGAVPPEVLERAALDPAALDGEAP